MELDHVEAFLAIASTGSFSRASAALHISQPAISRRIQLLEHELGAPLFDRIGRGVAVSDAGRAFLPRAQALVACVRDAIDAVAAARGSEQGTVTLALVGTLASSYLATRLRALRREHPELDLRLRTALSAEVSTLVLGGDAALGLRYGTDPNPDLTTIIVHQERLVPVCAASDQPGDASQDALAGRRWLAFPSRPGQPPDPYSVALHQLLAAHGLGAAEILPVDSLTAQKRLVEAGFGIAILPESSLDVELRNGTLRVIGGPRLSATIPVALIRRRHAFQGGAARALAGALIDWQSGPALEPQP